MGAGIIQPVMTALHPGEAARAPTRCWPTPSRPPSSARSSRSRGSRPRSLSKPFSSTWQRDHGLRRLVFADEARPVRLSAPPAAQSRWSAGRPPDRARGRIFRRRTQPPSCPKLCCADQSRPANPARRHRRGSRSGRASGFHRRLAIKGLRSACGRLLSGPPPAGPPLWRPYVRRRSQRFPEPAGRVARTISSRPCRKGAKPPAEWRIGTEHEKFSFYLGTNRPVPYEGDNGIAALLAGIAERTGASPTLRQRQRHRPQGCRRLGRSRSSPAASSSSPARRSPRSTTPRAKQPSTSRSPTRLPSRSASAFSAWAPSPTGRLNDIPLMPKSRYAIMRPYMDKVGTLGSSMMMRTCTIQANLDFGSEADMVKKFRVALALQPIATAIFANSPFVDAKPVRLPELPLAHLAQHRRRPHRHAALRLRGRLRLRALRRLRARRADVLRHPQRRLRERRRRSRSAPSSRAGCRSFRARSRPSPTGSTTSRPPSPRSA